MKIKKTDRFSFSIDFDFHFRSIFEKYFRKNPRKFRKNRWKFPEIFRKFSGIFPEFFSDFFRFFRKFFSHFYHPAGGSHGLLKKKSDTWTKTSYPSQNFEIRATRGKFFRTKKVDTRRNFILRRVSLEFGPEKFCDGYLDTRRTTFRAENRPENSVGFGNFRKFPEIFPSIFPEKYFSKFSENIRYE